MPIIYTRADHLAQQNDAFEPQRTHNWAIHMDLSGINDVSGGAADQIINLSLMAGFLPKTNNENLTISYGNEEVYIAGKATSDPGQIVCRDWVDQPTAAILLNWRRTVYNPLTGAINLARNYKCEAEIVLAAPNVDDPTGAPRQYDQSNAWMNGDKNNYIRVWRLQGCWPMQVNAAMQGLDMTRSEMVYISVDLRFDKAIPLFAYGIVPDTTTAVLPDFPALDINPNYG